MLPIVRSGIAGLGILAVVACGGGSSGSGVSGSGAGDGGGSGASGGGGTGSGSGASSGGTGGSSGGTGGSSEAAVSMAPVADDFGGHFRHGMNDGHVNPNFSDDIGGWLGAQAGADSTRMKLPEYFLDQWGVGIRTEAATSYVTNGMSNMVCFLIGPSDAHSTAPAGMSNSDYYIPKNLYEPIFQADGTANPNNYWAKYVEETVTTYKPWVRIWEVWNEPDWTPDYTTTQKWATQPPSVADLPRFNGSIFDYVRMLRVTYAVAKHVDPTAQVALGGIGYPTFLSAILRYTDDPAAGGVSSDYPARGGAYFDVLNFHYYPIYTPGNSDAAADGMFALKGQFAAELTKAGATVKSWNATETGAPRYALGTNPGGDDYAKNYLMKVMTQAHLEGMIGLDWFLLSDTAAPGGSQDPYAYMGLYLDIASLTTKEMAIKSSLGVAYATVGKLLKGATVDAARTAALALPANVGGGAFHAASGHTIMALWARATSGEAASGSYMLAASGPVTAYAWDYSSTGASTTIAPSGGQATLTLGSTPQLYDVP